MGEEDSMSYRVAPGQRILKHDQKFNGLFIPCSDV